MNGMSWAHVGVCVGLLVMVGGTRAATGEPNAGGVEGDRAFLRQALGVNEVELRLGRLASERGGTPEVKAAGVKMIAKHTQLGGQLRKLAEEAGMPGDGELTQDQRATVARVESESETDFDSTFERTVDDGHVKELAMYREEAARASSPRLRALAEQRVVALQGSTAPTTEPGSAPQ